MFRIQLRKDAAPKPHEDGAGRRGREGRRGAGRGGGGGQEGQGGAGGAGHSKHEGLAKTILNRVEQVSLAPTNLSRGMETRRRKPLRTLHGVVCLSIVTVKQRL